MIPVTTFKGGTVAVFGLGGSGLAVCRALAAGGAVVAAWDDNAAGRDAAATQGFPVVDLAAADWSRIAALVLAPGVPLTHPEPHWVVSKAKAAGVEIIGDIELLLRERAVDGPEAKVVAITGTNGKSTTTALVAHILRSAGCDAEMGGNIGVPVLDLQPPGRNCIYVIEMSSFQIDLTPSLRPSVGVLLNLSPDHLDRHGTMEHYAAIKERLIAGAEHAVAGDDDDFCRAAAGRIASSGRQPVRISARHAADVFFRDGALFQSTAEGATMVADLAGIGPLRGRHNGQNAAAALAVAVLLRIDLPVIARALATFPGLPHRMEEVGRVGNVAFINDSKATNADSTEKALASWDRDIFWILGGKPKEGGIAPLEQYFPRVARAYLIGQAAEEFAATLAGRVPHVRSGTLAEAVKAAAVDAAASRGEAPIVLLSPACASYDQFRNFEIRGNAFRDLVAALPGAAMRPRLA